MLQNLNDIFHRFIWQKARKREIIVSVEFCKNYAEIETLEGPVRCEVGDAVVTGVHGERWPVQRALFERLYEPIRPLPMGKDGQYRSLPQEVDATCLTRPYRLKLPGQQGTLSGKTGDWLVRKQDGSMGIVAGNIFSETYDIVK